jgi:hypothetical protein
MKKLIYLVAIVLLSSCANKAIDKKKVADFQVEYLFTYDSIKVYRFEDCGYYHYFTSNNETMTVHKYNYYDHNTKMTQTRIQYENIK